MRIAVCDDDNRICDIIEDIIDDYSKKTNIFAEVFQYYTVESLIFHIKEGNRFNLIFQDIEFPNMDGLQMAEFIRQINDDYFTDIVFISGTSGYDRELFNFQPLYFISKPLNDLEVIKALELSLHKMKSKQDHFLYKKESTIIRVPFDEIIYFQSVNRKVVIYTLHGEDEFYDKLSNVEKKFTNHSFLRIHKSFLINPAFIKSIEVDSLSLKNNTVIPISRPYRETVKNFLSK